MSKKNRRRLLVGIAAILVVALSGCFLLKDDECETNSDCPSGATCKYVSSVKECVSNQSCDPVCTNRQCGSDGCGGTCGSCAAGRSCLSGKCVSSSCTPSCTGKMCGDDGCGGSCGGCGTYEVCASTDGRCLIDTSCPILGDYLGEILDEHGDVFAANITVWYDNVDKYKLKVSIDWFNGYQTNGADGRSCTADGSCTELTCTNGSFSLRNDMLTGMIISSSGATLITLTSAKQQ